MLCYILLDVEKCVFRSFRLVWFGLDGYASAAPPDAHVFFFLSFAVFFSPYFIPFHFCLRRVRCGDARWPVGCIQLVPIATAAFELFYQQYEYMACGERASECVCVWANIYIFGRERDTTLIESISRLYSRSAWLQWGLVDVYFPQLSPLLCMCVCVVVELYLSQGDASWSHTLSLHEYDSILIILLYNTCVHGRWVFSNSNSDVRWMLCG